MADNTNKVTIDADYFYELFRKANETDGICKECREENTADEFNAIAKERDELKKELDEHLKNCRNRNCWLNAEYKALEKERDELKAKLSASQNYEAVIAAKEREIEAVKEERNRLNAKVNELIKGRDERQAERDKEREKVKELKAKLDCADVDRETYNDRAEAAERCIEEMWSKMQTFDIPDRQRLIELESIIRAYREKKDIR